ncbi:sigma-70 family RNA polymerase sigma factor [Schinkia azotoformans]|uniref:sigma-70 family RNA polymerase sigma factor n=1 Tax=Schinkia azotoformans TaxID=1454 RepID=UPI002DBE3D21|nr:sigma-70 family RNA polymerase sigma factor [Schinkia azotoformans]MEC1716513.1 sigma-70 family RNA polymerase sigma factor [Schinkia azotoformans]MEC1758804.1 sigma-70 family RNA polymerase sigma factor [Schinkia azotoformans]
MDEKGFNQLYFRYKRKIYYVAFKFVKDPHLAEDLAHEVLIKCYFNIEKFNRDCTLDTWINRVAKNHCIDFLRRSHLNRVFPIEDVESYKNEEAPTPEHEVVRHFNNSELRRRVELLPDKYEEVISLYYFKNQSLKEIQHILNVNLSTVKTRLFRAKQMLKAMYKNALKC